MGSSLKLEKLVRGAEEIFGDEGLKDLCYLHLVLAQCGLPYREVPEDLQSYHKVNGKTTLIVGRGYAYDQKTKEVALQRIPFGVKPRVLLLHLCPWPRNRGKR